MRAMQRFRTFALAGVLACWAGAAARAADEPSKEGLDFFEKKIRPVLVKDCYECHSEQAKKVKGKLRLDTYEGMLKGGESGKPSLVPGKPNESQLYFSMTYKDKDTDEHDALLMPPPKDGKPKKVPDSVLEDFKKWIEMGAPYPKDKDKKADATKADPKSHWAFVPPKDSPAPQVKDAGWVKNPIDSFVLAKLEEKNLHPTRPADKRALIRRAYFDLIGLPPTMQEVEAFEADASPDAFAKVVDHLLSLPQYGQRWGRYWLDVARYADTKGYVFEEERRYPYSYTYRDYVIRAFNEDLPYDQFLIQQIAADRLDLGDDKRPLAAEGFLTLGRRFLNNQADIIDDRIDVVCRGTMALTVGCARCHDHKFDPISQKDYYALYAVFANSPENANPPTIVSAKDNPEFERFEKELTKREAEVEQYKDDKLAEYGKKFRSEKQLTGYLLAAQFSGQPQEHEFTKGLDVKPRMVERWKQYLQRRAEAKDEVFSAWRAYAALPADQFSAKSQEITDHLRDSKEPVNPLVQAALSLAPSSMQEVAERYAKLLASCDGESAKPDAHEETLRQVIRGEDSPIHFDRDHLTRILNVEEGQHLRGLVRAVEQFKATDPASPPRAMSLADASTISEQHVFLRGNPGNWGAVVKPAFLSILAGPEPKPFTNGSGRLEFARDIASKDNPLTARVMVNRIWLHHFGFGLVRTPSDFGTRSDAPTHPELLDWLAIRFMDPSTGSGQGHGWSIKSLHRLIMLSATYQQASDENPQAEQADPDNKFLWRMNRRRLDWEATRDELLAVSGKIDLSVGGRAVDLLSQPFTARRTVYGFIDRQNLPGLFRAFDFASPDTTSPQRFTTTVPQQALFLMNSPFVVEQAKHLVARPDVANETQPDHRIAQLYRDIYQRNPSAEEVALGAQFVGTEESSDRHQIVWQYGYGRYDEASGKVTFTPLPHFTGDAYQGGGKLPDAKLGWVMLTALGGHPGNDQDHAAIRRWVAPADATITIRGTVAHRETQGDGVRARVVSSRQGELASWNVRHMDAQTNLEGIEVKKGDIIDFVVDCRGDVGFDSFEWSPTIKVSSPAVAGDAGPAEWSAAAGFAAPPARDLSAWEKYAQVLLESNEFVFVD